MIELAKVLIGLFIILIGVPAFAGFMVLAERSKSLSSALFRTPAVIFWVLTVLAAGGLTSAAILAVLRLSNDFVTALSYLPGAWAAMAGLQYASNFARRWAGLPPRPPLVTGD